MRAVCLSANGHFFGPFLPKQILKRRQIQITKLKFCLKECYEDLNNNLIKIHSFLFIKTKMIETECNAAGRGAAWTVAENTSLLTLLLRHAECFDKKSTKLWDAVVQGKILVASEG